MNTRRWSKMCTRSRDREGVHPTTRRQCLLASLGNGGLSEVAEEIPSVFRHVRKIGKRKTTGECLEWNMKEGIGVQELVAGVPSASSVEIVIVQLSKFVEGRQEMPFRNSCVVAANRRRADRDISVLTLLAWKVQQG